MERLIQIMVEKYNKILQWNKTETKFGIIRSGMIATISLMIPIVLFVMKFDLKIVCNSFCIFGIIFCIFVILFLGEVESSIVSFISRGNYNTWKQLLKTMTHKSYICGVIIPTFIIIYINIYMYIFIKSIFEPKIHIPNIDIFFDMKLFCAMLLVFSFFYFAYHIYINPEKLELSYIRQRLKFYMTWGTAINFGLLIMGKNGIVKIFITGLLFIYSWIDYLIVDKENKK